MKSIQELVEMSGQARRQYLEAHKAEISLEWLQAAKVENDCLGQKSPGLAVRAAEVILEAAQASSDPIAIAVGYWAQGNAFVFDDRPRQAVDCFEQARQHYIQAERPLDVARVDLSRLMALIDLGYPDVAVKIAGDIKPVLESSPDPQDKERLVKLQGNLGIALEVQGDYELALAAYERKQALARSFEREAQAQIARADQNRAVALTRLNRFDEAEAAYRQAIAVLEAQHITADVARAYTNLGWMYNLAGRDEQASWAFAQAREWLTRLPEDDSLQEADLALSVAYQQLGQDASAVVHEAARLRQAYAGRAFLYEQEAALLEARARLRTNDLEGARRVCAEVEQALAGRQLAGLLWQAHYLTGLAWRQEGKLNQARTCYEKAIEFIERDLSRVADIELRASALSDKLVVYQELAALLVQENDYDAALQIIERGKARALVDSLWSRLSDILIQDRDDDTRALRQELSRLRDELDRAYRLQKNEPDTDDVRAAASSPITDLARLEETYIARLRELGRAGPRYGTLSGFHVAPMADIRQTLASDTVLAEYYTWQGKLGVLLLAPEGNIRHHSLCELFQVERLVEQLLHHSLPDEHIWVELYLSLIHI